MFVSLLCCQIQLASIVPSPFVIVIFFFHNHHGWVPFILTRLVVPWQFWLCFCLQVINNFVPFLYYRNHAPLWINNLLHIIQMMFMFIDDELDHLLYIWGGIVLSQGVCTSFLFTFPLWISIIIVFSHRMSIAFVELFIDPCGACGLW